MYAQLRETDVNWMDMRWMGAVFCGLLGLAFGSFLNVCLSRLPEGESIVTPRSHCRDCEHVLSWWENLPLASWIFLRGRCRNCQSWIGVRYPLVELAVGLLWAGCWMEFSKDLLNSDFPFVAYQAAARLCSYALLCLILVALATLDAESFWLPDWITLPGILLGVIFRALLYQFRDHYPPVALYDTISAPRWKDFAFDITIAIVASSGLVLVIRLVYWLVRRKEGMGLGDAKLMGMLAAWLGLSASLECFALAILGATATAILWLAAVFIRHRTHEAGGWANMPLPLGTFLCVAGLSEIFWPGWLFVWWSQHFLSF